MLAGMAFAMLAFAARPAFAGDAAGWYVVPSYHQTGLNDANNTVKQQTGNIRLNSSFGDDTGPGFAAGYAFDGPYRVDVEYQSHSNDLKLPGTILQSSSLDATTFVANVWRDFGLWHGLRPYAGVGFGGGTLKLNDLDGNFAFVQGGIGVEWYFTRRAALDVGYRYQQATSNPELNGNSVKLTTEYASQSAQIGVRFDLGSF